MQHHRTNNPYEAEFGYSRAVRKGPFIFVSGTTSIDPASGELQHPGSAYDQARTTFDEIVRAVVALGGRKGDIVRVRMFVAEDEDTAKVGEALKDALGDVSPAATMIVGSRFVSSDMLVEVEADAVVMVRIFENFLRYRWRGGDDTVTLSFPTLQLVIPWWQIIALHQYPGSVACPKFGVATDPLQQLQHFCFLSTISFPVVANAYNHLGMTNSHRRYMLMNVCLRLESLPRYDLL